MNDYSITINSSSEFWKHWGDRDTTLRVLEFTQGQFNTVLKFKGFVVLSDVYEALEIPRMDPVLYSIGWVKDDEFTDNFVDFGLYKNYDSDADEIVLNFNCDGIILDILSKKTS